MQHLVAVFIGGGIGSILRYGLGNLLNKEHFAFGTLLINLIGSLLIGFVMGLHFRMHSEPLSDTQMAFVVIGIFGGFTTFSSFMYENIVYLYEGAYWRFFIYLMLSIIIGLVAAFLGFLGGKSL